jgi:hypothetical protein
MKALPAALADVRKRIGRYRGSRAINEQNTKATLIEPVLRSLGWDLEDLEEVQREYKRKRNNKPVDYALLILRQPRLFVEAKALGQNLQDAKWAGQIMGYAVVAGVKWVVLTDGDEYRIYNSHAPVPFERKLFRTVRLSDGDSPTEETLSLLSKDRLGDAEIDKYWNAYFVDGQVAEALDDLFSGVPERVLINLVKKRTDLDYSDVKASLGRARLKVDFPLQLEPKPPRPPKPGPKKRKKAFYAVKVNDLIAAGLVDPPLDLVREYKGHTLTARIEKDGRITCLGESFDSPSYAGGHARKSIIGSPAGQKYPQTAGWHFWKYRDSKGQLRILDTLRKQYLEQRKR